MAHFDSNKDYLAVASNPVKRVFITSLWDSNLQAELEANSKMVNVHAIKTDNDDPSILIWLKDFLIGYQPVYIRQYKYSLIKQNKHESFSQFYTRKLIASREANLSTITADDVMITELITGVTSAKLFETQSAQAAEPVGSWL